MSWLKWIFSRAYRKQTRFTKAFERGLRAGFDRGEVNANDYQLGLRAAKNPEAMKQAMAKLQGDPNLLGGIKDWDWEAILKWFNEYIVPALKIIIPIIMMLDSRE